MSVDMCVLVASFARLVSATVTGDVAERDRANVEGLLADAARVQAMAEAVRLAGALRLDQLAEQSGIIDPEQTIARQGRTSHREASRTLTRAKVAKAVAGLGDALAAGVVSTGHLDAVSQALARLEPAEREQLAGEGEWITGVAAKSTPDELARTLKRRVQQLSGDGGLARFERQRRATSLRTWTDRDTGMVRVHGELDPENGAKLLARLHDTVETLFHDAVPDTCPLDDRKQDHLRALALIHLVSGTRTTRERRPEFVVVIDHDTLCNGIHQRSRIDIQGGVELPIETLRRLACLADIIPVVLGGDGVALDVGRAERLATEHQRRALRAMYPTCAINNCRVAFDHCVPHHLLPWDHGGPTDLANLIPLCSRHHHYAHEGGWILHLNPHDRVLTTTLPDSTTLANPPPYAHTR